MNTSLKIIAMTIFSLSCDLVQLVLKIHNQLYAVMHNRRPISYRKFILQITQSSQYKYTNLKYRFAVTFGAPSTMIFLEQSSSMNVCVLNSHTHAQSLMSDCQYIFLFDCNFVNSFFLFCQLLGSYETVLLSLHSFTKKKLRYLKFVIILLPLLV